MTTSQGGDDDGDNSTILITVVSRDKQTFQLPREAALHSEYLCNVLDMADESNGQDKHEEQYEPVDVVRVAGVHLEKVVTFLKQYVLDPMPTIRKPLEGQSVKEVVTNDWYANFITEMTQAELRGVLAASNFMTIPPLLDLACLQFTFMMFGKSEEQIRQLLKLPRMTPEEEAQARDEHAWVFKDDQT